MKSRAFVILAAMLLLSLLAGCASQAGSTSSTSVPVGTQTAGGTPSASAPASAATSPIATPVASPNVAATGEVTATSGVTATSSVTGTGNVTTTGGVTGTTTVAGTTAVTGTATAAPSPVPTLVMPPLGKNVQAWPVLWDPEYGFEVRYPTGWLISQADTSDKDKPLVRAYELAPANWKEDWSPIRVEISEGTEQEFRGAYKQPNTTEQRSIGPLAYTYESTGAEGSVEHYAVFQSRDNAKVRVVIHDAVTGYPSRIQAHADLGPLVQQVIETFRWRR